MCGVVSEVSWSVGWSVVGCMEQAKKKAALVIETPTLSLKYSHPSEMQSNAKQRKNGDKTNKKNKASFYNAAHKRKEEKTYFCQQGQRWGRCK